MTTVHKILFTKKDGCQRRMNFLKLDTLKKSFLTETLKGGASRTRSPDTELVWDIDVGGFRIVNWNTSEEYREVNADSSLSATMREKGWID